MVTGLAKETQMELVTPVILGKDGAPRFRNSEALAFLERHFLRHDRAVYEKEQDAITIHVSKNAVEEVLCRRERFLAW